jgi:hypothetical protein
MKGNVPVLKIVDTQNKRAPDHVRHRAAISKIKVPFGTGKDLRLLDAEIAATVCGRYLRAFSDATDIGLHCTDGSVYSTPCAVCLPETPAEFDRQ